MLTQTDRPHHGRPHRDRARYRRRAQDGASESRDRAIARPALGVGRAVRLPDNLPADLVSRRPDIVAARWRVDPITHALAVCADAWLVSSNAS